jgi:hypothetical protein
MCAAEDSAAIRCLMADAKMGASWSVRMDAAVAVDAHTSVHRSSQNRREFGFPRQPP